MLLFVAALSLLLGRITTDSNGGEVFGMALFGEVILIGGRCIIGDAAATAAAATADDDDGRVRTRDEEVGGCIPAIIVKVYDPKQDNSWSGSRLVVSVVFIFLHMYLCTYVLM